MPPDGAAFFVQLYEAVVGVEVFEGDGEGAAAAAGGFCVEAGEGGVEDDVVAVGACGGVDVFEFVGGEGSAGVGVAAWFRVAVGGAGAGVDVAIGDGAVVDGAGGGGEVFAGVAAGPYMWQLSGDQAAGWLISSG